MTIRMLGLCFLTVTPCWITSCGQPRLGRRDPVLREDVGGVLVDADLEVDVEQHAAVARVRRLHVDHVVDAVDFLLDGRGDRLLHRDRRGARVGRRDADRRRGEERVLLEGELLRTEAVPSSTVRIAMTIATIGRPDEELGHRA